MERDRSWDIPKEDRTFAILAKRVRIFSILVVPILISLACAFLSSGPDPDATSTSLALSDILTFQVPISVLTLDPGETIPYTQLTYESHEGNVYRVLIDHQPAEKRVGDSFRWRGVIAPGISASYDLRIAPTFSRDNMLAGGSVEIGVFDPVPTELDRNEPDGEDVIHFGGIFVDLTVPLGEKIPGTTLGYEEQHEQGAGLSGVDGYPYRAVGDSVIWSGRLRENVDVRYSLRIITIKEDSLRLLGTAELWISPSL